MGTGKEDWGQTCRGPLGAAWLPWAKALPANRIFPIQVENGESYLKREKEQLEMCTQPCFILTKLEKGYLNYYQ